MIYQNNSKLLGLYDFNDKKLSQIEEKLKLKINKKINKYDIVIVSDYGHSFINQKIANILSKSKKMNMIPQLNSANFGSHTIGKYKNANCAIINEVELRHEVKRKIMTMLKN